MEESWQFSFLSYSINIIELGAEFCYAEFPELLRLINEKLAGISLIIITLNIINWGEMLHNRHTAQRTWGKVDENKQWDVNAGKAYGNKRSIHERIIRWTNCVYLTLLSWFYASLIAYAPAKATRREVDFSSFTQMISTQPSAQHPLIIK